MSASALQKLKTLSVIEVELGRRLDLMKKTNINVQIAVTNRELESLAAIASVYARSIDEMMRMTSTMDKLIGELKEELGTFSKAYGLGGMRVGYGIVTGKQV